MPRNAQGFYPNTMKIKMHERILIIGLILFVMLITGLGIMAVRRDIAYKTVDDLKWGVKRVAILNDMCAAKDKDYKVISWNFHDYDRQLLDAKCGIVTHGMGVEYEHIDAVKVIPQ